MKIWVLLVLLAFIVACAPTEHLQEEAMEAKIESETGQDAEVDIDGDDMNIKMSDGEVDVEVTGTGTNTDEWCKEGAEWKMTANVEEGPSNAQWTIQGLETSGEYAGLCYVKYIATGPDGTDMTMDYYFDQSGENGYIVMDVNGQKMKQEWHR